MQKLTKLFAGQQWRETWRTALWTQDGAEGVEDGMYGDSYMETYSTICKIHSQWEFAVMTQGTQARAL